MPKATKIYLTKTANIEDRQTGEAVIEFSFRKIGGGWGRTTLKPSELLDHDRFYKHLLDRNALLPADEKKRAAAIDRATSMMAKKLVVQPRTMGWQNKRQGFLAATGAVGNCGRQETALPSWLTDKHTILQAKKGTLEGWIKGVATPSCSSSVALVSLCAGFAAPLLKPSKMQAFGLNIYGISKAGKTSALLAGASIGGIGVENRLPNFRSTPAARGELCCAFNDQLLPLNEVGLLAGKSAAYEPIRTVIYQISEGRDTIRHSGSEYAKTARASEYRTIFVSTSEHSFDRYAKLANQRRDEGEYARCLDLAACAEGGHTIMDRVPKAIAKGDRREWRRNAVIQLRTACAAHHGHALPAYIEHLLGLGKRLKKEIRIGQKAFLKRIDLPSLEGALQHAARNVSLLAAGGRLAIQAGLLPITEKKLMLILSQVFQRSVAQIGIFQSPEKAVRTILTARLANIPVLGGAIAWKKKTMRGGFAEEVDGKLQYTINTSVFRSWFGGNSDKIDAAIEFLGRKGKLILPDRRKEKNTKGTALARAVCHPIWPNGKPSRSIKFRDPLAGKTRSS